MNPLFIKRVYFSTLIDVVNSINLLTPVSEENVKRYVRLEEATFSLSKEVELHAQVVTAHKLSQYLNPKYSVKLEDAVECWLDWLIEPKLNEIERTLVR